MKQIVHISDKNSAYDLINCIMIVKLYKIRFQFIL